MKRILGSNSLNELLKTSSPQTSAKGIAEQQQQQQQQQLLMITKSRSTGHILPIYVSTAIATSDEIFLSPQSPTPPTPPAPFESNNIISALVDSKQTKGTTLERNQPAASNIDRKPSTGTVSNSNSNDSSSNYNNKRGSFARWSFTGSMSILGNNQVAPKSGNTNNQNLTAKVLLGFNTTSVVKIYDYHGVTAVEKVYQVDKEHRPAFQEARYQ